MTTTTRAATHDGTCQVCGSVQRLPGGLLAKHGYTTKWGFFSGVCHGAGALPFEQDKGLIEAAIARVAAERASLQGQAADLRNPAHPVNAGPQAWVHEYQPGTYFGGKYRKSAYKWRLVEITESGRDFSYRTEAGTPYLLNRVGGFPHGADLPAVILWLHASRARTLDMDAERAAAYLAWQADRIKGWKPRPLLPRR
jgi:hypothetical protein